MLFANIESLVIGRDLVSAVFASEEFDETARLVLLLRGQRTHLFSDAQTAELGAQVAGKL